MQRNMEVMKYASPPSAVMMQIQLYLQENSSSVTAGKAAVDKVKPNADAGDFNNSFKFGSWLALAPFFILVFVGLLRWWGSHKRQGCEG